MESVGIRGEFRAHSVDPSGLNNQSDSATSDIRRGEQFMGTTNWRDHGVNVIPADTLDPNTAQTPGMTRVAAINLARVGAQKIWAGTVSIEPNAKTGAHHHGHLESVIYVVKGRARMRWGERLEFVAEAAPGDFIYVPPFVPHQEINASGSDRLECVLVRSDNKAIAINLDIAAVEEPETVYWIDPTHPHPDLSTRLP
jgi:uncharacterized RmlC-like cupin family protein